MQHMVAPQIVFYVNRVLVATRAPPTFILHTPPVGILCANANGALKNLRLFHVCQGRPETGLINPLLSSAGRKRCATVKLKATKGNSIEIKVYKNWLPDFSHTVGHKIDKAQKFE